MVLAEVDSTMEEAQRRGPGLSGPEWVLALIQTAARGRRGRPWVHPKGNFAATVLLPGHDMASMPLRSFAMALALYDALSAATGRVEGLALKWPNDVLLNGGKVAGILLESLRNGPDIAGLAIGIGVNLAEAPGSGAVEEGATPPVSVLSETGAAITPEEFLDLLAPAFAHYESQLTTYGFAPIREAWLSRAARLGEPIRARLTNGEVTGTFEGIDDAGQLVLNTPTGRQSLPAADVFF